MSSGDKTGARRRRILLVGPLPPPVGGDTISTANLLASRYWVEAGFEISCIDTSAGGDVKLAEVRRTWKDPARALRIMANLLCRLPHADLMLLWANSSFVCSLGVPVMNLARMTRKPYIVKLFGTMLPERIESLGSRHRRTVLSLLGGARYLLPQTGALVEDLAARSGLDRRCIVQFPNFLPDSNMEGEPAEKEFSGRCAFIGQIKSEKGVFDIVEALKRNNSCSCDFYGQLAERDRETFEKGIAAVPNLRYMGTLERGAVVRTLKEYDVLLLPTTHPGEGYPAVILEAFAAGIPVIATAWKSIPELVVDGETGLLVPPSSPTHIAEALDLLSRDTHLYESLARSAREYVGRFSEKKIVGDLLIGLVKDAADR